MCSLFPMPNFGSKIKNIILCKSIMKTLHIAHLSKYNFSHFSQKARGETNIYWGQRAIHTP